MDSFTLILLGATGDLSRRKIWPSLYDLFAHGAFEASFSIVAVGRTSHGDASFRKYVAEVLVEKDQKHLDEFVEHIHYSETDATSSAGAAKLDKDLQKFEAEGMSPNRIFHLAILPELYGKVSKLLFENNLHKSKGWVRLLIEKPFGTSLSSAKELDVILKKGLGEDQIFRTDHYLAKETVQNILAFRFGNGLLEPIWNRDFIDHIEIHQLEEIGVEGRGKFYDNTGTLHDVVQNHLLQVLAVTTMDRPDMFTAGQVREKRAKLLQGIKVYTNREEVAQYVVRGQYEGYKEIQHVDPHSTTETFVALRLEIEQERWQGVPIYIRAGKKLGVKTSEVSIVFKQPKSSLFPLDEASKSYPTILTLRLSPNEGIAWQMAVKKPGMNMSLEPLTLAAQFSQLKSGLMEPYEKILLDAYKGDQTLFASSHEVEAQWRFVDPISLAWQDPEFAPNPYPPGSNGPADSDALLERDGRKWHEVAL
ncbi:MAG TPA: glucose-6-phosphate dehydrogenase [Patescibacteria group bacterium]|nr:glucose-6-phosphate dehydrogenase [Patescibacteria group bacterium]